MGRRARLLKCAHALEGVLFREISTWMGCLEGEIATSEGIGGVSIQDGSDGDSIGPFSIPQEIHGRIAEYIRTGEPIPVDLQQAWESYDPDGIAFDEIVAMVRQGAVPNTQYHRLAGEDMQFGTDPDVLRGKWLLSLECLPSEWNRWEDMDTDQIADILQQFEVPIPDPLADEEADEDEV